MTKILLVIFIIFSHVTYGQDRKLRMTVILSHNKNPSLAVAIDTLLKKKEINLVDTPIDLFYVSKNFNLPYYVPTDGIFKNESKIKECDMRIYPKTVKCYYYDKNDRVIKMTVSGSGTMNNFIYKYNDKNQIIEILDNGHDKFTVSYNPNGTISGLTESSLGIEKRLVFIYD